MATMEDLIATISGSMHVGQDGYDLKQLQVGGFSSGARTGRWLTSVAGAPQPDTVPTASDLCHGLQCDSTFSIDVEHEAM